MTNLQKILEDVERRYKERFLFYSPHPKQAAFHEAGKQAKERFFLAGNRTGKTMCAVIETAMHLTGNYPDWWNGYRYKDPVDVWVASNTAQTTRDITQKQYYFGRSSMAPVSTVASERFCREFGVLPKHLILRTIKSRGSVSDTIDNVEILHSSGGVSTLGFKAYDQGRERFQGTRKDIIHFDEEPPYDVYLEALIRTMGTHPRHYGMVMTSMTPKKGMTQMVSSFYQQIDEGKVQDDRFYIQASWEDNPHLSEAEKDRLEKNLSPSDKEAMRYGIPSFGSGLVYPVPQDDYLVDPFRVPMFWPHVVGLDFGWTNPTAALVCAIDPETRNLYLIAEYKEPEKTPAEHVPEIIKMLGTSHINVVCDPSGGSTAPTDGRNLIDLYRQAGITYIRPADNDVEKGLMLTLQMFQDKKLKIFRNLTETIKELRSYARDENKVIKRNDHLMDALRYVMLSGCKVAQPLYNPPRMGGPMPYPRPTPHGWMAQ